MTEQAVDKRIFQLHVVSGRRLLNQSNRSPNVSVRIKVDSFLAHTKFIERSSTPVWNDTFKFSANPSSMLVLEIVHSSLNTQYEVWGTFEIPISTLLDVGKDRQVVDFKLRPNGDGQNAGVITVRFWSEGAINVNTASKADAGQSAAAKSMAAVISKLQMLAMVMDENAPMYPCASFVLQAISSVYKIVKDQLDNDPKIADLIASMDSVYSFANDALATISAIGFNVIFAIVHQTFECFIFIQEYVGCGFSKRALKEAYPGAAIDRIERFTQKFVQLKSPLSVTRQIFYVSSRMLEKNDFIENEPTLHKLQQLQPLTMGPCSRPECLPGTGVNLLGFIINWATSPPEQHRNILWLYGVAGSGKSTLSTTIANLFRTTDRLGAYVFFSQSKMAERNTSAIIRTLAHQLGLFDHRIGQAITTAIDDWPDCMQASARIQFQKFLVEPLTSLKTIEFEGPIVLVLDGLDECGSAGDRSVLIEVLAEESIKLPSALRFIITSRPEYDIRNYFESRSHIQLHELDIRSDETRRDVKVFLHYQFGEIARKRSNLLPKAWPTDYRLHALVERASGLFVWASDVCKYVDASDPEEQLGLVLDSDIKSEAALDAMYITALENAGLLQDTNLCAEFRALVGTILVTKRPLSAAGLNSLLGLDGHAISRLGSVLYGNATIHTLHPSFDNFITSRARCKYEMWFIDLTSQKLHVAVHCLDRLDGFLTYNICDLQPTVALNKTALPEDIVYACCYWVHHVCLIKDASPIADKIEAFLFKHLVHWLEAMSILNRSRETFEMLGHLRDWHRIALPNNTRLQDFIGDACQFAQIFVKSIEEHPLSIYTRAFPSAKNQMNDNPRHQISKKNNSDIETSSRSINQPPNVLAPLLLESRQMPIGGSLAQSSSSINLDYYPASEKEWSEPSLTPTSKASDLSPELGTKATYPDPFFRHLTMLPTLNATLYEALATDIIPCSSPLDFVYTEANHINNIVQALWMLTQNDDIHHASFVGIDMIYRRLIVYIFAHLMLCTSNTGLLKQFKETVQQWKTWDIITVIQNHQMIKDRLWGMFKQGLRSNPSVHAEEAFHKLVAFDAIGLSFHLAVVVTDNSKYKEVLAQRGPAAQSLLNLLQARLDFYVDPLHKSRHVKALLKLSRASGLYPKCFVLKDVEIEPHPIARGGYGDVYKGSLQGQAIAVKALRIYKTSDLVKLLKDFSSEAVLWRQLCHPNVLPFYGIYDLDAKTTRVCLTSPWMENGNVAEFITSNPRTFCVHLALDAALGLEHLHNLKPSIIHGDLKGANLLITRSGRAVLADFGLATAIDSKTIAMTHNSTTKTGGTVRWQAPELHNPKMRQHNSEATDIYAFACVCYEMFSGEIPFYEDPSDMRVILGLINGLRPARPKDDFCGIRGLTDEVWNLIETCWTEDPTQRPTATQLVKRLRVLPNQPVDERPVDDFSINFPPNALYNHTEHPFSALAISGQSPLVS